VTKKLATKTTGTFVIGERFTFTDTGVIVAGKPTFDQFQAATAFAQKAHKASSWWVADLVAYGETRSDWQERHDAVLEATGYAEKTVQNLKYIGENIHPSRRRDDVAFSVHSEVVSLEPKEQEGWLERAATEGWSQRELRSEIQAAKRTKVIKGQAILAGKYRVIYADPPWLYSDSGATNDGSLGKAAKHYPGMTVEDICKLPVEAHALPDATLFMWVTAPMLEVGFEVVKAWGFTYKTNLVWDKVLGMPTHYALHGVHEHLIIAVRGRGMPDKPTPQSKSIFTERRSSEHSAKPQDVRKWIEKHWVHGKRLELFARAKAEGWTVFGNDARLWGSTT